MSVLTFKSEEYKSFPPILKEYASYQSAIKGNSEKTVCEYLLDLRTFFRYLKVMKDASLSEEDFQNVSISDVGVQEIKDVTTETIIDFLMYSRTERENSATTRMRKLSSLRSFYRYAHIRKHYVDVNPTADIDAPKKSKKLPKYLTLDEAVLLLQTVKNDTESKTVKRDYAIINLFLNTGMRLSELVGLNLESFDSDLKTVKVLGKGNKERIMYLNDSVRSSMISYLSYRLDSRFFRTDSHAMFLSRLEKRISNKTVQWLIYKYLNLSGLGSKGLSVHKLRHTAATLMYQSGKVDIRILKDVLGHEQLNTTQIYTHIVNQDLQYAVDNNPLSEIKISSNKNRDEK